MSCLLLKIVFIPSQKLQLFSSIINTVDLLNLNTYYKKTTKNRMEFQIGIAQTLTTIKKQQ